MVDALHAAGLEVVLDVVFNHTAEGRSRRPDAVSSRAGQRCLLPTRSERPSVATSTRPGAGNSVNMAHRGSAADDHGFAALLGDRDGRRRFPVRSGAHPRPARMATSTRSRRSSTRRTGPGRVAGEADRGTVGRRPHGQLRHRSVSIAVERVERALPRHRARLVAQPRWASAGLRDAAVRIRGYLRPAETKGAGPAHRSTSSPCTMGSPSMTLFLTTASTTRRTRRDNRDGTDDNRSWNCGAEGPTDDPDVNSPAGASEAGFPC